MRFFGVLLVGALGVVTGETASSSTEESANKSCCFRIGYGAMMKPCCLKIVDCTSDFLNAVKSPKKIVGGGMGVAPTCPADADIADKLIKAKGEDLHSGGPTTPAEEEEVL